MFYRITKTQHLPGHMALSLGAIYCAVLADGLAALGLALAQFKPVGNSALLVYHCRATNIRYSIETYGAGVVLHHGQPGAKPYRRAKPKR